MNLSLQDNHFSETKENLDSLSIDENPIHQVDVQATSEYEMLSSDHITSSSSENEDVSDIENSETGTNINNDDEVNKSSLVGKVDFKSQYFKICKR